MRRLVLILLLIMSFVSQGIASDTTKQTTVQQQVVVDNTENDDFEDEFKSQKEVFDPLSGYNRAMTSFNDFFYVNIVDPTARGYAKIVPEPARKGISNFFHNITFPIRLLNNILQFKFENAAEETGRFLINSTFGLLGFLDPATTELHWKKHNEDFGQTLGFYGIGEGFHIVLPFFGPSNLRDSIGLVADAYVSPITDIGSIDYKIPDEISETFAISGFRALNDASLEIGQYENLKKDAIDLYPFLRDIYNQNREKQIRE